LNVNKHLGSTEGVDKATGNMPSSPDLTQKGQLAASLDRNKSALELSNIDPSSAAGGLRKVASIANYNLVHRDPSLGTSPPNTTHLSPIPHHFGTHQLNSSHHSISTIPEDQGLMMSVRPSSGIAANALNSSGACSSGARHGLMESASAAINTTSSPPKSALGGVMGGIFGRGFFAKPVIRSDEENYRYIMALDRN